MFKKIYSCTVCISILFISLTVHAAEKERVAILDFNEFNCPKATAKIITDMVGARVFESKVFTIVEREQIKQVFDELALQMTGCTDSNCAVKIGQMLSAGKIILGTVHKADMYIIVVKVVNVANNKIEGNYRAEAFDGSGFDAAVKEIADKIKSEFKTDMFFSASISGGYLAAIGDFKDLTKGGAGANLNFYINNFIFKGAVFNFATGAYFFSGAKKSIDSIMAIPAIAYLGYSFNVARSTKIAPYIGGGYFIWLMNYDKDNADQYGKYEYKRETFYDPAISVRCDIEYSLSSTISAFIAPSYTFAFEKKNNPQTAGGDAGIKMYF
jgi:hypothetical protein